MPMPQASVRSLAVLALLGFPAIARKQTSPSLSLVDQVLISTARQDFDGNDPSFQAATNWYGIRLLASPERGSPYMACAEYGKGRRVLGKLESFLSNESLRRLSNNAVHGACFFATATASQAAAVAEHLREYDLDSFGPLPSALKLAPDLLDHERLPPGGVEEQRLATTHGKRMRMDNVVGLEVALSPGVLPSNHVRAGPFIESLMEGLMSGSVNLYHNNFWSDPALSKGDHLRAPSGALRAREWTRAGDVVHELSTAEGPTPGDICSWGDIKIHHAGTDVLMITGMDHLLHLGRGVGGKGAAEVDELQMACFMGLVSFLAAVPEVVRIAPFHVQELKNAVATAITQSGNDVDKPLTAAGLDGTGQVIQIVDSGLDETSCYFADDDGGEVEHGYIFEIEGSSLYFNGGYYPIDSSRRKVIQYIRMVAPVEGAVPGGSYTSSSQGNRLYWYDIGFFGEDFAGGHGTHTAGSAAGASLSIPADTGTCSSGELGCLGGCYTSVSLDAVVNNGQLDWDALCPQHDCDGLTGMCLSEDISETLTENGGSAQGAKLSILDASIDGVTMWSSLALNELWTVTEGTECYLHSNSLGADVQCTMDITSVTYDSYMYQNPEHLLLFAAGNEGDPSDSSRECTINSPGLGKNVLTVGATSSGPMRRPVTGDDGEISSYYGGSEADIDTVAYFSSYGFTRDDRIKPEVVAPGDQVLSASSDGSDAHSCMLAALKGTSMSTPIVAGAAAMVRQYFIDDSFYANDVNDRGLCGTLFNATNAFVCDAFAPSAATVKAMLINSANLMGGSSMPDGERGFGRVHLEEGMPLGGTGDTSLFVVDSSDTKVEEKTINEYDFEFMGGTGLELRATLTWLDPAASPESSIQLIHDLDLTVVGPDGTLYRMWNDGVDNRNVVERVIVDSDVLDSNQGTWVVAVSAGDLTTVSQPYSLVVTGPIAEGSGAVTSRQSSGAVSRTAPGVLPRLVVAAVVVALSSYRILN